MILKDICGINTHDAWAMSLHSIQYSRSSQPLSGDAPALGYTYARFPISLMLSSSNCWHDQQSTINLFTTCPIWYNSTINSPTPFFLNSPVSFCDCIVYFVHSYNKKTVTRILTLLLIHLIQFGYRHLLLLLTFAQKPIAPWIRRNGTNNFFFRMVIRLMN